MLFTVYPEEFLEYVRDNISLSVYLYACIMI